MEVVLSNRPKLFLRSSTALVAAVALLSSAYAQDSGGADEKAPVQTAEQALAADAASSARDNNIAAEEAARRMRVRLDADERLAQIRAGLSARYAGGYIVHSPKYGMVMRLTGADAVAPQTLSLPSGEFEVRFETGAAATLDTLVRTITEKLPALKSALPTLQGAGVDERSGEIVLKVHAVGAAATAVLARDAELTALIGQPVRIEPVAAPAQLTSIRGGTRLFDATGWCTGGFVGQTSTSRVLLTAGHCNDPLTFEGNDGVTNYAMTYVSGIFDADQDVQYHRSTTGMLPEFWVNTSTKRTLTGRRLRSSTYVGDELCHHGKATGYSCGLVTTTTFAPSFAGACGGQTCAPVWINLEGSSLRLNRGDSGGPVFVSTVAAGIQSSGSFNASTGTAYYVTYMTTDTLPSGVSLLYGP
jgi:hypothetical protein